MPQFSRWEGEQEGKGCYYAVHHDFIVPLKKPE